jgi:hypothetical protein
MLRWYHERRYDILLRPSIMKCFQRLCVLATACVALACAGVAAAEGSPATPGAVSRIPAGEWQALLSTAREARRTVAWRIRITEVSFFGGFYVRGHLLDAPGARVHLTWSPEATPTGAARTRLVESGVNTVMGDLNGVTTDHEALVNVRRFD